MFEVNTSTDLVLMTGGGQLARATEATVSEQRVADSPEAVLVEAVRGGDRDAFGKLYGSYASMVHGILLARVPYGEVGDLVQDVFLTAFRKLDTLRDAARFGPWVAMIARNRATDFHRHKRATEELSEELLHAGGTHGAEASEALEVIRNLPEAYRETLVLRLVEGMRLRRGRDCNRTPCASTFIAE